MSAPDWPSTRRLRGALACLAALAVTLVVGELAVRLFVATPAQFDTDPERGRIRRPGTSRFQWIEGRASSTYGELGLRDERPLPSGPGARILALGDSLTEAVEVPVEESWPRVLESTLTATHPGARVINAGQMALLGGEMLRNAEVLQPRLDARVVVIAMRPASLGLDHDARVMLPGYFGGRYVIADDGSVGFERSSGPDFALKRFGAVRWLKEHLALLDVGFAVWMKRAEASAARPSAPPAPPDLALVRRRADFLFGRLATLFDHRVVVVLIDRQRYLEKETSTVDLELERVVADAATAAGLRFYSTRADFRRLFDEQRRLPVGFAGSTPPDIGHLNTDGHAIVARAIAPLVEELVPAR